MTTAQHTQTRRAFIKAGGTLLALPLLESLGMQRPLSATVQTVTPAPKRMVFLGMGFGVTEESWYPDPSQIGEKYDMPKVLTPLAKHKNDLTIIQHLYHQYTVDGHFGSTFWLTGANRYAVAGQSFHNTISVDQVAAEQLGRETRFTSIQLSGSNLGNASDGHGPGLSALLRPGDFDSTIAQHDILQLGAKDPEHGSIALVEGNVVNLVRITAQIE